MAKSVFCHDPALYSNWSLVLKSFDGVGVVNLRPLDHIDVKKDNSFHKPNSGINMGQLVSYTVMKNTHSVRVVMKEISDNGVPGREFLLFLYRSAAVDFINASNIKKARKDETHVIAFLGLNYIRKPRSKPEIEFHNLEKTFNSFFWLKHFCQKSAQQESYCYITLSEAAEALSMRSNFYAIVDRVIKGPSPVSSGKIHETLSLVDSSCYEGKKKLKDFLLHIWGSSVESFPKIEQDNVVRIHRAKAEVRGDGLQKVDFRIFHLGDMVVFPIGEPTRTYADRFTCTERDFAKRHELTTWLHEIRPPVAACPRTITIDYIKADEMFNLSCRLVHYFDEGNCLSLWVEDGTECQLLTMSDIQIGPFDSQQTQDIINNCRRICIRTTKDLVLNVPLVEGCLLYLMGVNPVNQNCNELDRNVSFVQFELHGSAQILPRATKDYNRLLTRLLAIDPPEEISADNLPSGLANGGTPPPPPPPPVANKTPAEAPVVDAAGSANGGRSPVADKLHTGYPAEAPAVDAGEVTDEDIIMNTFSSEEASVAVSNTTPAVPADKSLSSRAATDESPDIFSERKAVAAQREKIVQVERLFNLRKCYVKLVDVSRSSQEYEPYSSHPECSESKVAFRKQMASLPPLKFQPPASSTQRVPSPTRLPSSPEAEEEEEGQRFHSPLMHSALSDDQDSSQDPSELYTTPPLVGDVPMDVDAPDSPHPTYRAVDEVLDMSSVTDSPRAPSASHISEADATTEMSTRNSNLKAFVTTCSQISEVDASQVSDDGSIVMLEPVQLVAYPDLSMESTGGPRVLTDTDQLDSMGEHFRMRTCISGLTARKNGGDALEEMIIGVCFGCNRPWEYAVFKDCISTCTRLRRRARKPVPKRRASWSTNRVVNYINSSREEYEAELQRLMGNRRRLIGEYEVDERQSFDHSYAFLCPSCKDEGKPDALCILRPTFCFWLHTKSPINDKCIHLLVFGLHAEYLLGTRAEHVLHSQVVRDKAKLRVQQLIDFGSQGITLSVHRKNQVYCVEHTFVVYHSRHVLPW